jgi:hypothetical protein
MFIELLASGSGGGGGKLVTYASATSDGGNNYNLTKDGEVIISSFAWNSVQHYEDENIIFDTSVVNGQCQRKFTNKKNGVFYVQGSDSIIIVNDTQESHYNTPAQYLKTVYQVIAE